MRKFFSIIGICAVLALTACSTNSDGKEPFQQVKVEAAQDGAGLTVTGDWPVKVSKESAVVSIPGTGPKLTQNQLISIQAQSFSAETGKALTPLSPATLMRLTASNFSTATVSQLLAAPSGSYVSLATPAAGSNPAKIVVAKVTVVSQPTAPLATVASKMPSLTFDAKGQPVFNNQGLGAGSNSQSTVLVPGNGDVLKSGSVVGVKFRAWQLSTQSALIEGSAAQQAAAGVPATLGQFTLGSCIDNALTNQKRGVQMLLLCTPSSTVGGLGGSIGSLKTSLAEIAIYLDTSEPEGAEQAAEGSLPHISFGNNDVPQLSKIPSAAPQTVTVKNLTTGTGERVKSGMPITVNYSGWSWNDGKIFDSTYESVGAKTAVSATGAKAGYSYYAGVHQVIQCWDDAIYGQPVGSTLLIGCPASSAYGDTGSPGRPQGPLVFVVKIESAPK